MRERMAPKTLGLWMLFLWIQEGDGKDAICGNDTGILGTNVELKCCYRGKDLMPNQYRVQWQLKSGDCLVAAYLPGRNVSSQCERYKNRTVLKEPYLHLGLLNVSLEDSKTYWCIIQKKENMMYQKIFQGQITLEITAIGSLNAPYLESPTPTTITPVNQQQTEVIAISSLVTAVVISTVILILYKRKHSLHRAYTAPVGMEMS